MSLYIEKLFKNSLSIVSQEYPSPIKCFIVIEFESIFTKIVFFLNSPNINHINIDENKTINTKNETGKILSDDKIILYKTIHNTPDINKVMIIGRILQILNFDIVIMFYVFMRYYFFCKYKKGFKYSLVFKNHFYNFS